MRQLRAEIEIAAPPERVWEVLFDFDAYPEWNPFIRRISGSPREGEKLEVRIEPPGGRGMTFKPTVLEATPNRELRWLGRFLVPRLFDGEHTLRVEPRDGEGRSRFIQSEEFRGILVPLFGRMLGKTEEGFRQMNAALKQRAERATGRSSGPGGEPNAQDAVLQPGRLRAKPSPEQCPPRTGDSLGETREAE